MSNTLTGLYRDAYAALDVISRELTGFIPSVLRDSRADRVAINANLTLGVTAANAAAGTITPAMAFPAAADQTITPVNITISKQRFAPFSWSGEEEYTMDAGPGALTIQQDQIAQAMRTLVNEMEYDIALAAQLGASRAFGAAATAPFATAGNMNDIAQIRKILDDNGAPPADRHLVINTTAGANYRALQGQVHMTGDDSVLRQGAMGIVHQMTLRESAQVIDHVTGTALSSCTITNGGFAKGVKSIAISAAGTGAFAPGDIFFHDRDQSNKYVSTATIAAVGSGGTMTINDPGLRLAITTSTSAVTKTANYSANIGFSRNAIVFATRLPATPKQGDMAKDRIIVTDARTGLSFELVWYGGLDMGVYRVRACWGVKVIKPEHVAILIS